jgi:thioredoxin-related protein
MKNIRLKTELGGTVAKSLCIVLFLTLSLSSSDAQSRVKWMKFGDAVKALQKEPRKIFVDIYADWCGWCKEMDKRTFSDTAIIRILNRDYYPVKLNSDLRDTVSFGNRTVTYRELASILGGERLGLPTSVFLNENGQLLSRLPGFQKPDLMKPALLYFSMEAYKSKSWEVFHAEYTNRTKKNKR